MVKLLLRCSERLTLPTKKQVYDVMMGELNSCLTGLRETGNGYNAYFDQERDMDRVLTAKGKAALKKLTLEVRIPPKMKARRSVICRKIDSYVGERSKDEMKAEIEHQNSRLKVDEIVKFKDYTHVFKIVFTSAEMAEIAQSEGIKCFNMKISSSQIQQEEYVDLLLCFHCYKWESHTTRDCPDRAKTQKCSECTEEHNYRDCGNTFKKCINCNGNHRTMSMACPMKKKAISNKINKEENIRIQNEHQTYSRVVKETIDNVTQQNVEIVTEETCMKAALIMMDAHMHNIIEPGSYSSRVKETLKANNLPIINFPPIVTSAPLLKYVKGLETTVKKARQSEIHTDSEEEEETVHNTTINAEILDRHMDLENITIRNIREYETKVFGNAEKILQKDLTPQEFASEYNKGHIKIILHPNSKYNKENIHHLIDNMRVYANREDITVLTPTDFRKIRVEARTPENSGHKKPKYNQ